MVQQSDRGFGITFAVVFTLVFGVAWLVFDAWLNWAAVLAIVFLAVALIGPGLLLPFNRVWSVFAGWFVHFNNHLILAVFYYLIMVPAGLIMRVFGNDPMRRHPQRELDTYWQPVQRKTDRENLSDMF